MFTVKPLQKTWLVGFAMLVTMLGASAPVVFAGLTTPQALGAQEPSTISENPIRLTEEALLLIKQAQYSQAEQLYKRALEIREKALGPVHLDIAETLENLAKLYGLQSQLSLAESHFKRSLVIRENVLGSEHPSLVWPLAYLAQVHRLQGRYPQVEEDYKRSLAITERSLGPDHPNVAMTLDDLAGLYKLQGRLADAELLYKRALIIQEKTFGSDDVLFSGTLSALADILKMQGKFSEAETYSKRVLDIKEKRLAIEEKERGLENPGLVWGLDSVAREYESQGMYVQAELLYNRSLAIREKEYGRNGLAVASSLSNLGALYKRQNKYAQAESVLTRSLFIREKTFGSFDPDVAESLHDLADLYRTLGNNKQAEMYYLKLVTVDQRNLGPDHPYVADELNDLSDTYHLQELYPQALAFARRASAIYRQRVIAASSSDDAAREASNNRRGFNRHLSLLSRNPNKEPEIGVVGEAFQIAQLEQATGTASAIAKMAARFAKGDDAIADLVKRKQDEIDRRSNEEVQLQRLLTRRSQDRRPEDVQRLRESIAHAAKDIDGIDAELTRRFPEYQELTRPEPVPVDQIRALLKPGEAMVVYAMGKECFLWVVKPTGAVFLPLAIDAKDVAATVATIRAQMEFDDDDRTKRVSLDILHELYQRLFAPAVPHLDGVRHILAVPAGPLQSLPFGMLVASPAPETKTDADYHRVDWLIKHYAFSVLPSVSSIQAFRRFAKDGVAQEPFAGFGDPLIGDTDIGTRGERAKTSIAGVFRSAGTRAKGTRAMAAEIADVEAIRGAARLPETAAEIRAMAGVLKGAPDSIWLKEKATETRVKALDLSRYRTIAFATHGLMAGEIDGVGEAGLILTPPAQGTLDDDGYLSAGEIAKLKLNADWVILSACNTAAADGTPGAEGLSGLAKAFFYAGARSLLVSQWPVWSAATVPLTTEMLHAYQADPAQGKAEAHRKAVLALMKTPKHPEYAHPIYWAPFVVVGEGGAGSGWMAR